MRENIVFAVMLAAIMGLIYLGYDFSLILFLVTALSGLVWAVHSWLIVPRQAKPAEGEPARALPEAVEYAKSFFPILLAIFVLRSFLYEPFRIPSGSMKPTLLEWDFILVEKFAYGVRLPVVNKKIVDTGDVQRGDVVVFRYPENPSQDYIKRVVGLPGDRVVYSNKQIIITPACHEAEAAKCPESYVVPRTMAAIGGFVDRGVPFDIYTETLGEHQHRGLVHPMAYNNEAEYYNHSSEWRVPQGHYFVMGDNRDNSRDSRFWGFVPDENLKGRAVAVWLHLEFPFSGVLGWVPVPMLFSHLGGIK